jgi:hypothetical protein
VAALEEMVKEHGTHQMMLETELDHVNATHKQ